MSGFIPTLGTRGLYTLLPPFDTALLEDIPYTCIAVRRLADIIAAGGDPKAEYYTPNALTDAQYAADIVAGVCIITLQAESIDVVYVPSSYISGFPEIGGIPYTQLLLAMDIGALPDSLDLTYVKGKLADVVLENLGVTTTVKTVVASLTTNVTDAEHATLETARQALIGTVTTDHARYLQASTDLAAAQAKITELENFIISLNLPPTTP